MAENEEVDVELGDELGRLPRVDRRVGERVDRVERGLAGRATVTYSAKGSATASGFSANAFMLMAMRP